MPARPAKVAVDDRIRASRQPHRRGLADGDRMAEEAESPIGRMLLRGQLNSRQDSTGEEPRDRYHAATLYAAAVGAYRSVIGGPKTTSGGGRGYPCDVAVCAADDERQDHCECLLRKVRYNLAYEALAGVGRRSLMAVNAVAIHRQEPELVDVSYVLAGLEALRRHFGLMNKKKKTH